jgi:hypothetical protein
MEQFQRVAVSGTRLVVLNSPVTNFDAGSVRVASQKEDWPKGKKAKSGYS